MAEVALIWLHVTGNLLWVGSLLAAALLLASGATELPARATLARLVYLRLAVPGFVASFLFGAIRLALSPGPYLVERHSMHGKLLFAVAAIAIHHVVGARARRAAGATPAPRRGPARWRSGSRCAPPPPRSLPSSSLSGRPAIRRGARGIGRPPASPTAPRSPSPPRRPPASRAASAIARPRDPCNF